jgi:hypothetical protein
MCSSHLPGTVTVQDKLAPSTDGKPVRCALGNGHLLVPSDRFGENSRLDAPEHVARVEELAQEWRVNLRVGR